MKLDPSTLLETVSVADGGWSTQLQMRGAPTDVPAEAVNLTHAEIVQRLAQEYLDAGARFITTNTFGANRWNLERRKLGVAVADINRRGAELARQAVGDRQAFVAGSIGPCGKILAIREVTEPQLEPMIAEQAEALAAGGADVILLETYSELAEILLALRVVKERTKLPVIASMSFDAGPQRTRTMMGAKAEDCAAALEEAGADAIGCNCGAGVNTILPAVVALRGATSRPLWVKPNAGLPDLEAGRTVYRQTPEEFTAITPTLIEAGANILGGCCGTGPEHIRRLAAVVAGRQRAAQR